MKVASARAMRTRSTYIGGDALRELAHDLDLMFAPEVLALGDRRG